MNFLKDYIAYAVGTEIPDIFMLWGGLSTISCTLGRRLWMNMDIFTVYPNIYVILVAGSGKCRKSTAINFAEEILRSLSPPPNLISQRLTAEALIDALRVVETTDTKHFLRETAEGFVVVDELKIFLNKKTYDGGLGPLLIPLWDSKEVLEYRTKGRGIEKLHNTCLGILGGSTIQGIREAIPSEAVGDGMCSRFIFVYIDKPTKPVPRPKSSPEKEKLKEKIIRQAQQFTALKGEVTLSKEAGQYFDEKYVIFYQKNPMFDVYTLVGYASRRFTHLLKIAMLFAVSEGSPYEISETHIKRADLLLEQTEAYMPLMMARITSSEEGELTRSVFEKILKEGSVTRSSLLQSFSHKLSTRELTNIIETLVHEGKIDCVAQGRSLVLKAK